MAQLQQQQQRQQPTLIVMVYEMKMHSKQYSGANAICDF